MLTLDVITDTFETEPAGVQGDVPPNVEKCEIGIV